MHLPVTRRITLAGIVSSAAAALLAACGGPTAPPTGPASSTSAPATNASAQPKSGGTLRFGLANDLTTLEPHLNATAPSSTYAGVYDRVKGTTRTCSRSRSWPDKYTVVLSSDQPRPLAFDFFEMFNIADRETLEGPDARTKAVGTGPFTFIEWVQGDHFSPGKIRIPATKRRRARNS